MVFGSKYFSLSLFQALLSPDLGAYQAQKSLIKQELGWGVSSPAQARASLSQIHLSPMSQTKTCCKPAPGLVELEMGGMGCKSTQIVGDWGNSDNPYGAEDPLRKLGKQLMFPGALNPLPNRILLTPHISSFPCSRTSFLPDEAQEPLPQSLGDHGLPQNFKLEICGSRGKLRGSSLWLLPFEITSLCV